MGIKKRIAILGISILLICVLSGYVIMYVETAQTKNELLFGATYMTMNNSYFEVLNDNIQEIIEGNGDILITRDPVQDQEKQNEQITDMIKEGIDVLFLNPVDWEAVTPALEQCAQKGIPVFVVDSGVYRDDLVVSTIMSDNYSAGVQCANDMMKKRKSANIIILEHEGLVSTRERVEGFIHTIAAYPQYRVIKRRASSPELEDAMEAMKHVLNTETDFDVVFGANDPTALGAIAAMQSRNMQEGVLVYGVDGSVDAKTMIKEKTMEATSAQSPIEIGRTAAKTAYDYLKGNEVEKKISIPVRLITKETLRNFAVTDWQ